jgi:PAS domain S-box-containing protein
MLLIFFGFQIHRYISKTIRKDKYNELKSIADLKIDQITYWHHERINDISVIAQSPFFIDAIKLWQNNPDDIYLRNDIIERFVPLLEYREYNEIIVYSKRGMPLLYIGKEPHKPNKEVIQTLHKVIETNSIQSTDFYKSEISDEICLDFIAPLQDKKNNRIGYLIFRINPQDFLYALIQSWPTPSKTSETLIIRRESDSILFLNELRYQKNSALNLQMPLSNTALPSVKAALGATGIFEGIDYRGIKVLSYLKKVPGTQWFMVAKVDKSEIFSEINDITIIIILIELLLFLLVISSLFIYFNARQKNIYHRLFRSEKDLLESQGRFKTILYSIGDAVITTDEKGNIKHMNQSAEDLTGWTESEAINQPLENVFHIINEIDRKAARNPVQRVIEEGIVIGLTNHTLLISKNGSEIAIADSGAPIKDSEGKITGVVLVFQNKSEEYERQREIQRERDNWQRTFNTIKDPIALLNKNGIIIKYNQAFYKKFHTGSGEITNKTCCQVLHNSSKHVPECLFIRASKTLKREETEYTIDSHEFMVIADPILNLSGKFEGIVLNMYDITLYKHTEEELKYAKMKAEESNNLKTSFLHNISHEIRTPMNAIVGFSNLLKEPDISREKQQNYTELIIDSSHQLLSIVDDVVNISTIEAGRVELNMVETDINKILQSLYNQYYLKARAKKIKLIMNDTNVVEDLVINTDEIKLFQILSNLISNSIKYTDKGKVEYGYYVKNNIIEFYVKDTGIGINSEDHERIFERFYRIENSDRTIVSGMGLGLSISKLYCDMMGGKIWLESAPNKGSAFYFYLPLNPVAVKKNELLQHFENKLNDLAESPIILIAEDEPYNLKLIEEYLDNSNIQLIFASNGIDVVEKVKANSNIALILMDIKMPLMNGLEATKQIRSFNQSIPIIAQTAYSKYADKKEALSWGCNEYLIKPIHKDQLIGLLNKYLPEKKPAQ